MDARIICWVRRLLEAMRVLPNGVKVSPEEIYGKAAIRPVCCNKTVLRRCPGCPHTVVRCNTCHDCHKLGEECPKGTRNTHIPGGVVKVSPEEMFKPYHGVKMSKADEVAHPQHYQTGRGLEAIAVIEAFAPDNYHRGNALKYLLRAGKKDDLVKDLRKAIWYIEREIERA